ncbi:MAG: DPP IV N-terminal domain-containing protein, partial [Pirellulaceae bacterium]
PYPGKVTILGYRDKETDEQGDGLAPQDYRLSHYANFETTLEVQRPFAYLMGSDHGRVAQRLLWHGVELHQLTEKQDVTLDQSLVTKIDKAKSTFQGHRTTSLEVTRESSTQTIPAGTYIIYTGQPLAHLITYLLEPRSDDGFTTWNFFDHAIQTGKAHPVSRISRAIDLSDRLVETIRPSAKLTLDQIYGPRGRISFGGSFPLSLRWIPKTDDYRLRSGNRNYRVDAESGARTLLPEPDYAVAQKKLETLLGVPAKAAAKLAKGGELAPTEKATLYRHKNDLLLYDHGSQELRRLTNDKQVKQLVTFSSDARYVAFVRKYNLVIVPTSGGPEVPVTTEGAEHLLHGYLDWVYQEELYGRGNYRGFWWSPGSKSIAFLQLDERPVAKYPITDHLAIRAKSQTTYYPKAGDALPKVSLAIYQLGAVAPRTVDLSGYEHDILISHVNWSPDGQQLYFQVQNRQQTWLDLCTVGSDQSKPRRLLRDTTEAWVQSPGAPHYLDDGSFLWLSEATGYRHIQHITANRRRRRSLTAGKWEVQKILGVDEDSGFVYFLGNRESGAESHAYRVPLGNGRVTRLTRQAGNHSVRFKDSYSHYIDYVSGIHRPVSVSLHRADGTWLRTLAPNLVDHLEYYHVRQPEFVEFAARDGHPLSAILIKPPNFNPGKQYPVLCYVYGGPQAPVVRNRWQGSTYLWHQYLAQQGYVIWISDNRAATHKGARGAWSMHLEMGKTELQDLEDGINWLGKNAWVDRRRVGIWGWSYGGYLVSYALTHSKLFKAGIAGAPVTDWRNYDAIYTERYMGLPKDNPEGYKKSSPVHAASRLHGKLLLIHGALDDNVHLSNTLQFSNALQTAGKQFELMIYPNNRHGITRPGQSRHLRDLMTQFILDNL